MNFVHYEDMRAAGLEPINVLSQAYKCKTDWASMRATKDCQHKFSFFRLFAKKGVYVFEYTKG